MCSVSRESLLGTRCGAVVAMNPHSGAVYVMASTPTYDLNLIDQPNGYAKVLKIRGQCSGASALYNRATQGLYTPGSTFKVVTAAAALDTGAFTPTSGFDDPGYCTEYGKKVSNAGNPDQGGREVFGHLNFSQALQHSVNSVFCNIGKKIGAGKILSYVKRFGFYKTPPLETPGNERLPSGLYSGSHLFDPKDPATQIDPGRLAFGQERLLVTPLQMAMVASTIGNGGVVPRPYVVQKIVAHDGSTIRNTRPGTLGRAIKPADRLGADADDGASSPRAAPATRRRSRASTSRARPARRRRACGTSTPPGSSRSPPRTTRRSRSRSCSRSS